MNLIKKLLCTHYHDIETHPQCFAQGCVNENTAKSIADTTGKQWFELPEYKIGILDIEADGLKSDWATMLTWCIKDYDGEIWYDYITREELFEGFGDERIVNSCSNKMKDYKIIIGYYSTGYDLPFLRTKALRYNLDFPRYGELYHFDLYYTVKSKLNLSSNRLENVCDYLDIEGKTPIDKDVWRKAKYGDAEAIKEVLEHNKGDVCISEALYKRLIPFRKWLKKSI